MTIIQGAKKGQQKAYTPSVADDSVASISKVKILYGLSEGEVKGLVDGAASIMLDGTPLIGADGQPNFDGVEWEFRNGTVDQTHINGMPNSSTETAINVPLRSGTPWTRAINNTELSSVNINLSWSRLSETTEKGDVKGVTVAYSVEVNTGGYGWVKLLDTTITAKTSGRYQRTHNIVLPPSQSGWQIRVSKATADGDNERVFNNMNVDSIAEVIDAKLRYPHTALLYLSFDARAFSSMPKLSVAMQGRYIKVPTNYNADTHHSAGLWNGQFKTAYSNNPAWIYYDLVTNDRYGLGDKLKPFMIDKWAVEHIARICDERVSNGYGGTEPRFTCNLYLQTAEDAYRVLQHIAGIFRGVVFWNGSQIVLDADTPRDADYVLTRANVVDGQFVKTGTAAADRHTIAKVGYSNPKNAYETDYAMVRNEQAIAQRGINILDLSAVGCTSESQAYRMGKAALLSEQLRTQTVAFSMGLDGSLPTVGSRIDIADMMFKGANNGGRIAAVNANRTVITVDRDNVPVAAGDKLIVNLESGKAQSRTVSRISGRNITVTSAFEPVAAQNVWAINTVSLPTMPFIVMSIVSNDDGTQYDYTAMQYDPAMYALIDDDVVVDKQPLPPAVNPSKINAPTSVTVSSRTRVEQGINIITLMISWSQVQGAVAYQVEYQQDNGSWTTLSPTGSISLEVTNVSEGTYVARVRAVSAFNVQSKPTLSQPFKVVAKVPSVGQQLTFNAVGILFGMFLSWQFGADTDDTDYVEIQAASDPAISTSIAELAKVAYPTNSMTIQGLPPDWVQFYRARLVDKLGNKSDWTPWVEAITSADAEAVLKILNESISNSQLDRDLRTEIGRISDNATDIAEEVVQRSSETSALITKTNTLQSSVNGNTALVQQQAKSIDGLYGQYTVKVDVNGRVSGFGLASSNYSSTFAIRADRFYIAPPNSSGMGDAAFVYQSTAYTDPISGTVIPSGLYLKDAFIANASMTTAKIRGQAVTVTSSASGVSSSGRTSNVYINSGGGSVLVRVVFYGLMGSGSQIINLYKNGALLSGPYGKAGNSGVDSFSEIFEVITSGSYGTDSFYATWTGADYVRSAVITATSLKR